MSLRNRLTLQFGLLASLVLGVASIAIFLLSSDYRKDEFSQRLISRGENMAKLLIQIEEVDENLLNIIERDNPVRLPEEEILIFNFNDSLIYSSEGLDIEMPSVEFLNRVRLEGSIQYTNEKRETEAFLFIDRYDRLRTKKNSKSGAGPGCCAAAGNDRIFRGRTDLRRTRIESD